MGLWTMTHLYQLTITILVLLGISILAAKTLGKCRTQIKYIPLQIIAVILLVLEVMKQIMGDQLHYLHAGTVLHI